jgi:AraC family transcriptional regulator
MSAMTPTAALRTELLSPIARPASEVTYRGGTVLARFERRWTGIHATLADVRVHDHVEFELRAATPRLSVMLDQIGGRVTVAAGPGIAARGTAAANAISVIGAKCEARAHGSGTMFLRHLVIDIDGPAIARLLDEPVDLGRALTTRLMLADERLMTICRRLGEECMSEEPANRLYTDGLAVALLQRLAALTDLPREPIAKGGLAAWQLRRVLDHLNSHLADDVPVARLADMAGLSPSYFRQAFKVSTGMAPHQWLVEARCRRAKQLLIEKRMPLAEIALEVGFCDQAHFTRSFVRAVGVSPGAWRRERSC